LSSAVAGPFLLDKRLLIVTGKGGVGKSTVAAAMALLGARQGKRVLVCEVNAQERIAPLLGAPPSGPIAREATRGIWTINVMPQEAMREYGLMVLKLQTIYQAVFENRVVRLFLRAIPSLAELVMLGKILHEVRSEDRSGHPIWDLVILDAPSTGHAVQLLRLPAALIDLAPAGLLRRDAKWMRDLLVDPVRTALSIVTLPEELPVNEAIDLDAQVRGLLGIPHGPLFVNAMPRQNFEADELARLDALAGEPPPLGPAAAAARRDAAFSAQAAQQARRAQEALDLPVVFLPALARAHWDREAVEQISDAAASFLLGG
jgi:hypothetical protein